MSEETKTEGGFPWDRLEGETVRDFTRFERYRLLGPTRNITAVYLEETPEEKRGKKTPKRRNIPATKWYQIAERNRWKERAEAWDLFEIDRNRIELEADRRKSKRERIKILKGFLAKVVQAAANLEPSAARWSDVTEALSLALKGLREEFGESSKVSAEVTGANGQQVQFVAFMPAPAKDPDEWAEQIRK